MYTPTPAGNMFMFGLATSNFRYMILKMDIFLLNRFPATTWCSVVVGPTSWSFSTPDNTRLHPGSAKLPIIFSTRATSAIHEAEVLGKHIRSDCEFFRFQNPTVPIKGRTTNCRLDSKFIFYKLGSANLIEASIVQIFSSMRKWKQKR